MPPRHSRHDHSLTGMMNSLPMDANSFISLDFIHTVESMVYCSGVRRNVKGNSVQIGDGPAAVTGDDRCTMSLTTMSGRRSQ